MKKLINISLFSLIAAFTVSIYSCAKLNQISPTGVQSAQLFKDSTGLSEALTGLYSTLEVPEYYGADYPMLCDLNSDNGVAGGYNNTLLNEFGAYSVSASNNYTTNTYVAIYKTIATANAILTNINSVTGISSQYATSVQGQALTLRAMAHFDLLRAFGYHWDLTSNYGIPIVTTVQTSSSVVTRSSVAATYAAIITDLTQAGTLLNGSTARNPNYVNPAIVNALLARVYLYKKDYTNASNFATLVINDGAYAVLNQNTFQNIYTTKNSSESIFELPFNQQNQSAYNATTYARPDAASTEVLFLANPVLFNFLQNRTGDLRASLVAIDPSGSYYRTLKYSSDIVQKDNSAFVLRISEMYLIRAEALGRTQGLADLNMIRTNRGLAALAGTDVPDDATYAQALADENQAEFNFEGHRYFDLARTGQVVNVLQPLTSATLTVANSCFPIPQHEINATNGAVVQNPGY